MSQFLANLPWILSLIYLVIILGVATLAQLFNVGIKTYYYPIVTICTIMITLMEAAAVFFLWKHSAFPYKIIPAIALWVAQFVLIVHALASNGTSRTSGRGHIAMTVLGSWLMLATALVMTFGT